MKKLTLSLITALCMVSLCSCGGSVETSSGTVAELNEEIAALQDRIAELEEENLLLKNGNTNPVSDNTGVIDADVPPTVVELNTLFPIGEVMDITLTDAEWADKILPSNTSKTYSYLPDQEGETFFVVRGVVTSHATSSFDLEWCTNSSIMVNDKYNFSATIELEDSDGGGFSGSIKPLQTRNFVLYSSVSDEVHSICETVKVSFEIPDNEEQLSYFYDEDHSNIGFTISFDNPPQG